ncbi:MAG: hypothetical protein JEZ04_15740 [Spirochaetales bacterium]|nr:hypothetical protein [Spirochaetales bacterium]
MRNKIFSAISVSILAVFFLNGCVNLVSNDPGGKNPILEKASETSLVYAGEVKSSLTNWNWFFQKSSEERRELLEQKALAEAVRLYGNKAVIKPEIVEGRWNPASLLMLLGVAGFVEDAEITASVWLPAPEISPEPKQAAKTGIRYVVVPAAEYTSSAEFTTVEYKPRETLIEELKASFATGEITEEALKKQLSRLPASGMLFITYGRTELTNAISRWFEFTLLQDGETIFNKRGTEDMPYVYGHDKLWWNDKSYKVNNEWIGSLDLKIEDRFQDKIYKFKIIREEYVITDSE